MMHLFVNGMAASAGGGLTYLRNVIPHLARRGDVRATIALPRQMQQELGTLPNIAYVEFITSPSTPVRFWQEQTRLPGLVRDASCDVLLSAGNFALRRA